MAASEQPAAQPSQPGLSEPSRIINSFVAPSKTFLDIRQNASWWVPLVLFSVFSISFFVVIDKKVGFEDIARNILANNAQVQSQTPEQQARTAEVTASFIKYSGYASPIFILFYALIIAAILMATFNFGMGAEVPFNRALAIVFYGWMPSIVTSVLGIVTVSLGDPEGFRLENPVGTNPAYFLDPHTTSKFVYSALTSLDVISLWMVVLIGIGFALNAKKKVEKGTAIGVVAGWYFVYKLGAAALAAMRG
jgi:hypothetical protein